MSSGSVEMLSSCPPLHQTPPTAVSRLPTSAQPPLHNVSDTPQSQSITIYYLANDDGNEDSNAEDDDEEGHDDRRQKDEESTSDEEEDPFRHRRSKADGRNHSKKEDPSRRKRGAAPQKNVDERGKIPQSVLLVSRWFRGTKIKALPDISLCSCSCLRGAPEEEPRNEAPSTQRLEQHRLLQQGEDEGEEGESEEGEGEEDESEDDEEVSQGKGKKKRRTKKDPSTNPQVFGFYPANWVWVFQQVKDRLLVYLLHVELFPEFSSMESLFRKWFNTVIAQAEEQRKLKLKEWIPEYFHDYSDDMKLMLFLSEEEVVKVFHHRYLSLIELTEEDYEQMSSPPGQQEEIEAKIQKVKDVLVKNHAYHMDGKDSAGKHNNFMNAAIGDLAFALQKIGERPLYKEHSKKFKTYSLRYIAACATLLLNCIDEYLGYTGSHVKFQHTKYLPVYNKVVHDLENIEKNEYHWDKTSQRWQEWADKAAKQLQGNKNRSKMVGDDTERANDIFFAISLFLV
ncbi:hypothetical protein R3P38DRAFT_3442791 [Favolaschia claudopus]|uniref:DUF6532 domain-containing protein n=1 Tax=Favolaschia claudopus TaxID=2862362 RepID=A0AAV9ZRL0_9AGAR